jgi:hypothetical protein
MNPGMSRATLWLGTGHQVIGIDSYRYDKPFSMMGKGSRQ